MELRSDVAAAAEKMVARDRVTRELGQLAAHLRKGERVRRLCSGTYPAGYGLMAITNLRVILLRGGDHGGGSNVLPLWRLSAVDWAPGLLAGTITIADPASCAELRNVELVEGEEIVRFIRARMRAWSLMKTPNALFSRNRPVELPGDQPEPVRTQPNAERAIPTRFSAPPPARSTQEDDTQRLDPVEGRPSTAFGTVRAGRGGHRPRQARSPVWLVAAAAGLVGLAGLGSYHLLSGDRAAPDMSGAPEPAAMNAAPATPPPAAVTENPVVGVVRVIDADSLEVAGGASGPVEVLGILAPQDGQCGVDQARRFATTKLLGTVVTLVADPSQPSADREGRMLAQVKLPNGMDYAVLASRAGVVKYHGSDPPVAQADEIKAAQADAERSNQGVWGPPCNGSFTAGPTP